MLALLLGFLVTWRAYRAAQRSSSVLSEYLEQESVQLERLALRLNQHGLSLQQTGSELFPKLERALAFLDQPLVAASVPWLLRRLLLRPLRRRG